MEGIVAADPRVLARMQDGMAQQRQERLGYLAVARGYLAPEQLEEALRQSAGRSVGEWLVANGRLTAEQLANLRRDLVSQDLGAEDASPDLLSTRYETIGVLGEGAMARVYRARDRQLNRHVALKVLRRGVEKDEGMRRRIIREAQSLAKVSHPNVVVVHDVIESPERICIVMELVEGPALSGLLAKRALSMNDAVSLMEKVARGVAAAHRRGIVHRDLKPGNILLAADGEPKVADFGLAQVAAETALTKTGVAVGTPLYMAPEQVKGHAREITPRTDVYALGAILYEALSGRPPHNAKTVAELFPQILNESPVPLRERDPALPEDLAAIVHRSLQKDPADRYATADELAEDLSRYRRGMPVTANRVRLRRRLVRWVRAHRRALAAASVLAVALAAVVWSALSWRREQRRRDDEAEAHRAFDTARVAYQRGVDDLYNAEAPDDAHLARAAEALALVDGGVRRAPHLTQGHYLRAQCLELEGRRPEAERSYREAIARDASHAASQFALGRLLVIQSFLARTTGDEEDRASQEDIAAQRADEAGRWIDRALASATLDGQAARDLARAMVAYARGDHARGRRIAEEGAARMGARRGAEDFHLLLIAIGLQQGESANESVLRALDAALRIHPKYDIVLVTRGVLRGDNGRGDVTGAFEDYSRALRVNPSFANGWLNRAVSRSKREDWAGAISDLDEAIRLAPDAGALRLRGRARARSKDYDGAIADYDRALALKPDSASSHFWRGAARHAQGRLDDAERDYTKAIELGAPAAYFNRAQIRLRRDDPRGAVDDLTACLKAGPSEPHWVHYLRSQAHARLGDAGAEAADLRRALELAPEKWEKRETAAQRLRKVGQ